MTDPNGTITDILCIAKDMSGYRPDRDTADDAEQRKQQ
jgi:hypothetical protein